jgi:UDP-2,3-diacylglucosamine pyrophosphatase LpxH
MQRDKYIWLTDTHVYPWNRYKLLSTILDQRPKGVFITGDISNSSQTLIADLDFLGARIGRPLYFVPGNHDFHFSSMERTLSNIRKVCKKHKNLVWMDEAGIIPITEEVCCIGNMGWYDARHGNTEYLKYTFDWFLIKEFKELPSMKHRIEKFRSLAEDSAKQLSSKLEQAVEEYKTIYLLSHFPAWKEGHRANEWISEKFYEPYNTNIILGQELEKVMSKHKKRHLICLMGHTHCPVTINVSRNIECRVGKGSYHKLSEEEILFI